MFHSNGKIPVAFLSGCGVPDSAIANRHALIGPMEPIQFYSCFISYSTTNQDFAERLHSKLRDKGLRVWFAPEDVKGGKKLHEQIDEAIRLHDKLLLVLSQESMGSEWVATEIRRTRKAERLENRRKLFPIRLVDFEAIRDWQCSDADIGKDSAAEARRSISSQTFQIGKTTRLFETAFSRLVDALKREMEPADSQS